MPFRITIILTLFLTGNFISIVFFSYFHSPTPLLSPLSPLLSPLADVLGITSPSRPNKIVYGFLPFWNLDQVQYLRPSLITHLAYFGLDFNPDGSIKKLTADSTTEPGWNKLNSQKFSQVLRTTKQHGGHPILVIRAMTQDLIESLVNQPRHRQTAIASALDIASAKNFDGVNIDFEYAGIPDSRTRNNFALFVRDLSQACKTRIKDCQISIDVFADSASKTRLWDFAQITPYVDQVIIMAYDFFRPASTQAGPVSPLRGACSTSSPREASGEVGSCLNLDVTQTVVEFTRIIPTGKIVLGVPYYGYQWQTASDRFLASAYEDSGALATYRRVQSLLTDQVLSVQTHWSNLTQTPWLSFKDAAGRLQQIHYEDERSLGLKYDLVNQTGLSGVAIWALGYDGSHSQLWQLISEKFTP